MSTPTPLPLSLLLTGPAAAPEQAAPLTTALTELTSERPLSHLILLGEAAQLAAVSAPELWQQCFAELRDRGCSLLVCGQSGAHYGLRDSALRQSSFELTGYMEILKLLTTERVQAINCSTDAEALCGDKSSAESGASGGPLWVLFILPRAGESVAERAWSWEQGLNLLLTAADVELEVGASFWEPMDMSESATYELLEGDVLCKKMRQLSLWEIPCAYEGALESSMEAELRDRLQLKWVDAKAQAVHLAF